MRFVYYKTSNTYNLTEMRWVKDSAIPLFQSISKNIVSGCVSLNIQSGSPASLSIEKYENFRPGFLISSDHTSFQTLATEVLDVVNTSSLVS